MFSKTLPTSLIICAEMGKMLLEKCDTITKEAAETQAALQSEVLQVFPSSLPFPCVLATPESNHLAQITQLKADQAAQAAKMNELATKNENLASVSQPSLQIPLTHYFHPL